MFHVERHGAPKGTPYLRHGNETAPNPYIGSEPDELECSELDREPGTSETRNLWNQEQNRETLAPRNQGTAVTKQRCKYFV